MFYAIFAIVLAYFIGAIPSGLLIGKFYGVDIRKTGSCNVGATNVTRCVGKKAGVFCFFCDFLKGVIPVLIARRLAPGAPWAEIACFAAAVAGHMFPVYLEFKGGKGIATAAGGAFAIAPLPLVIAAAVWYGVFRLSRYVSLASIAAAVALPLSAFLMWLFADPVSCHPLFRIRTLTVIVFTLIAALAIYRHRANITRLLNGTESRFEKKA